MEYMFEGTFITEIPYWYNEDGVDDEDYEDELAY